MTREALIVPTGVANLASVRAGLRRAGAEPRVEQDPEVIAGADLVVLPGVGSYGPGMAELRARGLDEALRDRVKNGKALLSVCLGLQLLCGSSEEGPGVEGLGIVPGDVLHFPDTVRAPQFGWNKIQATAGARWLNDGYTYFANSYYLPAIPDGWEGAVSEHGVPFVAALQRDNVLACQFHPELSGPFGGELLRAWVEEAAC